MKNTVKVGPINVICDPKVIVQLDNLLTIAKLLGYKIRYNWTLDYVEESYVSWDFYKGEIWSNSDYPFTLNFITKQPKKQLKKRLRGKLKSEKVINVLKEIEIELPYDKETDTYDTIKAPASKYEEIFKQAVNLL